MSPGALGEQAFEIRVEDELLRRGWVRGQRTYSPELGLDTGELFKFVGATQAKAWARLVQLHGGDPDTAQKQFALRVAAEIDARGVLDVLRQGVKDRGFRSRSRTSGRGCCWRRTRSMSTTRTCSPWRGSCTSARGTRRCRWTWRSS